MYARLSLRQNFSWNLVGNAIYSGSQWLLLVLLAKLGDADMVGRFALGLAVSAPLFMLTNLSLRSLQATDTERTYLFSDYLILRSVTVVLACCGIAIIASAAHYPKDVQLALNLIGLYKGVEAISDIQYGLFQSHERMDLIAKSMIAKGFASVVLTASGLWLAGDLRVAIMGLITAQTLSLVLYDIPHARRLRGFPLTMTPHSFQLGRIVKLARLALPLGFSSAITSVTASIPIYFLQHYRGVVEVGAFAAMTYLTVIGTRFIDALAQAASPQLALRYRENRRMFRFMLLRQLGIGLVFGMSAVTVAAVWGERLLVTLYSADYATYADVLIWVFLAGTLTYLVWFLHVGMTAARYLRVQVLLRITPLAISTIGCIFLVPRWGINGAAFAVLGATGTHFLSAVAVSYRMTLPVDTRPQ